MGAPVPGTPVDAEVAPDDGATVTHRHPGHKDAGGVGVVDADERHRLPRLHQALVDRKAPTAAEMLPQLMS